MKGVEGVEFEERVPDYSYRLEALANILEKSPGRVHPRLIHPEKRVSIHDKQAAELTYGQIVRRLETDYSPGLPPGAVKRVDLVENLHLMEFHISAINAYLNNHSMRGVSDSLAGLPVANIKDEDFLKDETGINKLRPVVEGHRWIGGYRVNLDEERSILIYAPWIQPWQVGGAPFPLLYTVGEVTPEELEVVTFAYGTEYRQL